MLKHFANDGTLIAAPASDPNLLTNAIESGKPLNLFFDSEFVTREKMRVISVQSLIDGICARDSALLFNAEHLSENFDIISSSLRGYGHCVENLSNERISHALEQITEEWELTCGSASTAHKLRKIFDSMLNDGDFDEYLQSAGLSRENIKYKREHKKSFLYIVIDELKFNLIAHFSTADLFKIIGKKYEQAWLKMPIESRRNIKFANHRFTMPDPYIINGNLCQISLILRDTMNIFPVLSGKSLGNQCNVYDADTFKMDLEDNPEVQALVKRLNLEDGIKANMDILAENLPEIFDKYAILDVFATRALSKKILELYNGVRAEFGLESIDYEKLKDTAGSNVSAFLKDLCFKHFLDLHGNQSTLPQEIAKSNEQISDLEMAVEMIKSSEDESISANLDDALERLSEARINHRNLEAEYKRTQKYLGDNFEDKSYLFAQEIGDGNAENTKLQSAGQFLSESFKASRLEHISEIPYNVFGAQVARTVGGLLYTRMARFPYLEGIFGDLDQSSCYATALGDMDIFIGEPSIRCFEVDKPKLRDALKFVESNCDRDAWFIRVSGKFQKSFNTILHSDLKSDLSEKISFQKEANPNKKLIESWDAYKLGKNQAESTILYKECKFSLITAYTMDCIRANPQEWIDEYLDLDVDALVFVPRALVANSISDAFLLRNSEELRAISKQFNAENGDMHIKVSCGARNVCLKMPVRDYYKELKAIRKKYKKAKNPIQEVYKLILNASYGSLACPFLPVNNPLAANIITSSARATAWLMMNSLNGFQVITDGCTFSWNHIPLGRKFKDILEENPKYLLDFDASIDSGISDLVSSDNFESECQNWIDENFIQHMRDFYQSDCISINRFAFELKDEKYTLENGEILSGIRNFTIFANHGSGGYAKGYKGALIYQNGYKYNLVDPKYSKLKARSFKGGDLGLLEWYVATLRDGYSKPYLSSEIELLKLGAANQAAIGILKELESEDERIAHPLGFAIKRHKMMKLITRSQFLFQNEKQLRNFEQNLYGKVASLSFYQNHRGYWKSAAESTDLPLIDGIDYNRENKRNPVGLGFEILAINRRHKGNLGIIRNRIADLIIDGCTNFNAGLNLDRAIESFDSFTDIFALNVVLKANSKHDLKMLCINSADEATLLSVSPKNIKKLSEFLEDDSD